MSANFVQSHKTKLEMPRRKRLGMTLYIISQITFSDTETLLLFSQQLYVIPLNTLVLKNMFGFQIFTRIKKNGRFSGGCSDRCSH